MTIRPLDVDLAKVVLTVGMFTPDPNFLGWSREAEDGTTIRATFEGDALRLELSPSISIYQHHADKRISGGMYFEIAAKYAEKVNGTITQLSNVVGCTDGGVNTRVLAVYPEQPLMFEQVCPGFREVILGAQEAP